MWQLQKSRDKSQGFIPVALRSL